MLVRRAIYCILILFTLIFAAVPMSSPAIGQSTATTDAKTITGTVIETMNVPGYTYMLVAAGSMQNWVAIPETTVKTGSQVSYYEGMTMTNFSSKTLNKTFENIVFSNGLAEPAAIVAESSAAAKVQTADDSFAAALQAEQKGTAASPPTAQISGGSSGAIAPLQEISINKAAGENGFTVEEIFAKRKDLDGKKVRLQGKVVKFNANIMGKNWVHLQDGTGDPLQNSHDLVLTTDASPEINTIVVMEGILAADKDFGAGYKYSAIVEQASLLK
ncbi:MAG: DNA-binding protein [Pseudomonadota bacterium]